MEECTQVISKKLGGSDKYNNLVLIHEDVHRLIHSTKQETILLYLKILKPNAVQLRKINSLRFKIREPIIKNYSIKEHTLTLVNVDDYLDI